MKSWRSEIGPPLSFFEILGIGFLFLVMALIVVALAEGQEVTKPEWVAIYRVEEEGHHGQPPPPGSPRLELRVIVPASSEGEAASRAILHVQKYMATTDWEKVKFIEAQERTSPTPKDVKPLESDRKEAERKVLEAELQNLKAAVVRVREALEKSRVDESEQRKKDLQELEDLVRQAQEKKEKK